MVNEETKQKVQEANRKLSLHSQKEALKETSGKFEADVRAKGEEERRLEVNQKVLELLCASGLPPHFVTYCEWDVLIYLLDKRMKIYSDDTFSTKFIPAEATRVTLEAIELLKTKRHLRSHMTVVQRVPWKLAIALVSCIPSHRYQNSVM